MKKFAKDIERKNGTKVLKLKGRRTNFFEIVKFSFVSFEKNKCPVISRGFPAIVPDNSAKERTSSKV